MKKLITILSLVLVAWGCQKDKGVNNPCIDPALKNSDILCTMEYDPVCGCDGETYSNPCVATSTGGVTYYSPGQCGCKYKYQGTVVDYTGLDGCGLMIELNNGKILEPLHLPKNYKLVAGSKVELDYRVITTHASICMAGEMADIVCIREVSADCESIEPVSLDPFPSMEDKVKILEAKVVGNCLQVKFSYGGGCEDHETKLRIMPLFCGTPPLPPTTLQLIHNANGDLCHALITETRNFDLTTLQEAGKTSVDFDFTDFHGGFHQQFTYNY